MNKGRRSVCILNLKSQHGRKPKSCLVSLRLHATVLIGIGFLGILQLYLSV